MNRHSMHGISLIEVLVTISLIGVLSGLAVNNFFSYTGSAKNAVAVTDYRNIKVAVIDLTGAQDGPARIAIRKATGPIRLPEPLSSVHLSPQIVANVIYVKQVGSGNRPTRTTTSIDVYHQDGSIEYRYREKNGEVTEQEIDREKGK